METLHCCPSRGDGRDQAESKGRVHHGEGRTEPPPSWQHSELRTGCCTPLTEQFCSVQPHREMANRDGMEKTSRCERNHWGFSAACIPRGLSPGFMLCPWHHHHRVLKPGRCSWGNPSHPKPREMVHVNDGWPGAQQ